MRNCYFQERDKIMEKIKAFFKEVRARWRNYSFITNLNVYGQPHLIFYYMFTPSEKTKFVVKEELLPQDEESAMTQRGGNHE